PVQATQPGPSGRRGAERATKALDGATLANGGSQPPDPRCWRAGGVTLPLLSPTPVVYRGVDTLRSPTTRGAAEAKGVSRALSQGGGQAGQLALRGQIPQPRRQPRRQLRRIEQGRRLLVSLDPQEKVEQRMRLLVADDLVIVSEAGQLGRFRGGVLQVADLIDQPILLRVLGGEDSPVGAPA